MSRQVTPETLVNDFINNNTPIYVAIAYDDFDRQTQEGNDDYIILEQYIAKKNEDFKNIDAILNNHKYNHEDGAFEIFVCNNKNLIRTYASLDFTKKYSKENFCLYAELLEYINRRNDINIELCEFNTNLYKVVLKKANL